MVLPSISLNEAYATLGVEQGADLETVKKAYKDQALRTHPDKASQDRKEEATEAFQRVGAAYERITTHIDRQSRPDPFGGLGGGGPNVFFTPGGGIFFSRSPFSRGGGGGGHPYDHEDEDDGCSCLDDDEDDYYDDEDDGFDEFDFFERLFRFEMYGAGGAARPQRPSYGRHMPHTRPDIPYDREKAEAERVERLEREKRRTAEERAARIKLEKEKAAQAEAAAQRKANKAAKRQEQKQHREANADALRAEAERKAKEALEKPQRVRSGVFAAARRGDAAAVRKGVWEDAVDAAGGELLKGADDVVPNREKGWDSLETLLHIAVGKKDRELCEWLIDHNAEPEERDSLHRTAFNRALALGHQPVYSLFFSLFPPNSAESKLILAPPPNETILRLAVESASAETVKRVFTEGLVDLDDVDAVWKWIDMQDDGRKWDAIRNILKMVDGFTPPPSPTVNGGSPPPQTKGETSKEKVEGFKQQTKRGGRGKQQKKGRPAANSPASTSSTLFETPTDHQQAPPAAKHVLQGERNGHQRTASAGGPNRGRRGRGRGRGRGRAPE